MIYEYNPDYEGAKQLAYEVLIKYSSSEIPIDLRTIIKKYRNIRMISFSKFMKIMNLSYEDLVDKFGSEHGFTIYDELEDKYMIAYNEMDSIEVQRWTQGHELGHILKGHLKSEEYTLIHYNHGKHPMEQEANTFAKHLLVPFPLVNLLAQSFSNKTISQWDIIFLFNVSDITAHYIIEHLKKLYFIPSVFLLENKFKDAICRYVKNSGRDFNIS
ncbi:MAG: ImmA/IrrE family metallo-endopeptidase [Fusobacterium polymorphum]|uniref:IrrE N-terminal-like domain-containing protein n=1 Tax=Fusobacterium nucleatum subsp. polymorphum TaxID=76857 RepID=A0A2C6BJA8_FUSNP|nr:ImmA/IrrE family metallo-endopeptidase [Fusobacterium polymorphum]PHI04333.1 hypothetical protein CBG52_11265 [Fusobacterium polymorphum]